MNSHPLSGGKEFRDTRMGVQYAIGGIAGVGLVSAVYLFKASAHGAPNLLIAAGAALVATAFVLGFVYLRFGKPVVLRQTAEGVQRVCGKREQTIPYDQLTGFRAKWVDVIRNGVYSHTQVRFAFGTRESGASVMSYDATASYQTLKFEQLQSCQEEVAAIVAEHMIEELERNGRVEWTAQLALRRDGLEVIRKAGGAPEVVSFDRVSQWKVDEGVFKLSIDDSRRPALVVETSQWNFYPGLLLFNRLCDAAGNRSVLGEEAHVTIG